MRLSAVKAYVGQHGAEKDREALHTLAVVPPKLATCQDKWQPLVVFGLSAGRRGDHAYFDRAVLQRTQRTRERVPARLQKKKSAGASGLSVAMRAKGVQAREQNLRFVLEDVLLVETPSGVPTSERARCVPGDNMRGARALCGLTRGER